MSTLFRIPEDVQDSPEEIQKFCLEQLDLWVSSRCAHSHFSWPMDRIAGKPYGYAIHTSIVEAWNQEGRETEIVEFHRKWLGSIDNIRAAITR